MCAITAMTKTFIWQQQRFFAINWKVVFTPLRDGSGSCIIHIAIEKKQKLPNATADAADGMRPTNHTLCSVQTVMLPDAFPLSARHVTGPWTPRAANPSCSVVYEQTSVICHGLTAVEVFILYAQITGLLGFQSHFLSVATLQPQRKLCAALCARGSDVAEKNVRRSTRNIFAHKKAQSCQLSFCMYTLSFYTSY